MSMPARSRPIARAAAIGVAGLVVAGDVATESAVDAVSLVEQFGHERHDGLVRLQQVRVARARLRREEALVRGEDEGAVRLDPFRLEATDRH